MENTEKTSEPAAPSAWRRHVSLKTKLIVITVGLFAGFIWLLTFFSVTVLKGKFEEVLRGEQLASTRRLAAELDIKLNERIEILSKTAARLPPELNEQTLGAILPQFGSAHVVFSGGIAVIGLDGKAIADFPVAPGRRGTWFGDRDYFLQVVQTGRPYIDKPIMGRALKRPVLAIAVPVVDGAGKLRAVMTGITDLTAPNFLGMISEPSMAGKGELYVFSPKDNLIIAASDKQRTMTASSPRGVNAMIDRFADGFEGSGIATNSQGIAKLYSAVRVPAAKWIVMAALPTEVAFGPVRTMQTYLYTLAGVMTLLAVLLLRRTTRRLLAPLDDLGACHAAHDRRADATEADAGGARR